MSSTDLPLLLDLDGDLLIGGDRDREMRGDLLLDSELTCRRFGPGRGPLLRFRRLPGCFIFGGGDELNELLLTGLSRPPRWAVHSLSLNGLC